MTTTLEPEIHAQVLAFQRTEITEHHIYRNLAKMARQQENRSVLERIADDELRHYNAWAEVTGEKAKPDRAMIWRYTALGRVLGFTFALKLMERGEEEAQVSYGQIYEALPMAERILQEEEAHEEALLALLDEERLRYTGSMVLGLSDAVVELTGALAGLTLALQNAELIALTASITGIAAALSMAASEYLSTKAESAEDKHPGKAALYTGVAYIVTVLVLVLPYLLLRNFYVSLALALTAAVLIIAGFNYYISVARDEPFRRRFLEMAGVSLGVAALSFLIGLAVRTLFGIEL